jgi:hypothetical protein
MIKERAAPLIFEQISHPPRWICLWTAPQRRSNERPLLVEEVCFDYPAVWGMRGWVVYNRHAEG